MAPSTASVPELAKKAVLNLPRCQQRQNPGQLGAQWIEHLLAVLGRAVQLGLDGLHNLRVTNTVRVETEAAQKIQILPIEGIHQNGSLARPLCNGKICRLGDGFSVIEKPFVDVVPEIAFGFQSDLLAHIEGCLFQGGQNDINHLHGLFQRCLYVPSPIIALIIFFKISHFILLSFFLLPCRN